MTRHERERRVLVVAKLLLHGTSRAEIIKTVNGDEHHWGAGERTIDAYIQTASERFAKAAESWYVYGMGLHLARLDSLFAMALSSGDVRAALAVELAIGETLGLGTPAKAESGIRVIVEYADDPPAGV